MFGRFIVIELALFLRSAFGMSEDEPFDNKFLWEYPNILEEKKREVSAYV